MEIIQLTLEEIKKLDKKSLGIYILNIFKEYQILSIYAGRKELYNVNDWCLEGVTGEAFEDRVILNYYEITRFTMMNKDIEDITGFLYKMKQDMIKDLENKILSLSRDIDNKRSSINLLRNKVIPEYKKSSMLTPLQSNENKPKLQLPPPTTIEQNDDNITLHLLIVLSDGQVFRFERIYKQKNISCESCKLSSKCTFDLVLREICGGVGDVLFMDANVKEMIREIIIEEDNKHITLDELEKLSLPNTEFKILNDE